MRPGRKADAKEVRWTKWHWTGSIWPDGAISSRRPMVEMGPSQPAPRDDRGRRRQLKPRSRIADMRDFLARAVRPFFERSKALRGRPRSMR